MDPIVVELQLETRDWEATQAYTSRRLAEHPLSKRQRVVGLLTIVGAAVAGFFALHLLRSHLDMLSLIGGFIVCAMVIVAVLRFRMHKLKQASGSVFFDRTRLELDASGIRSIRSGITGFADWSRVQGVEATAEHIFLPIDIAATFVIPKHAISPMTAEDFVARIQQWREARRNPTALASAVDAAAAANTSEQADPTSAPTPAAIKPAPPAVPRSFWRDLKTNLIAGARIALYRRVQPADLAVSFDQIVALLAITAALAFILDWQRAAPDARFSWYGLYTWNIWMVAGLWLCALVARSLGQRTDTRAMVVPALALAPWIVTLLWALEKVPLLSDNDTLWTVLVLVVLLHASLLVTRAAYGLMRPAGAFVILLAGLGVVGASQYLYLDTHLWYEPEEDDGGAHQPEAWQAAESVFFEQPARIDEAVEKLEPQRPGVTDFFYVGFAGDGYQRVFRREALFGQRVFAERVGSGTRSLELINDYEDRDTYPLGTLTGLRYGLAAIAEKMDPTEDVLVLLLTSHGSKEDGISVRTGLLPIGSDVPPDEVRAALDEAGIKWRIVIVSACYSGVFVEPLKSDTTLVITAADADHTSFGCADDRDLTYFGEAFLRDALPKAPSLEAAFRAARDDIARRENAEKLTPSHPQIFVGEAIREKLAAFGDFPLRAVPAAGNVAPQGR